MTSARSDPVAVPIFDGHNDALTAAHHASLRDGGGDGHLDLPRMRAGGVRGGIFAIFTESREPHRDPEPRPDGTYARPPSPRVGQGRAAATSTAAAGRLLALERQGAVRIARSSADLDAAARGDGPPVAVLHLEGAEAIDPGLESLETWYAAGLRSLGPVWSRPNAFAHGVPFVFPSSPDTGPGLTRAGRALVRRCGELGIVVDLSHLNEAGFWDVARSDAGPLVVSHAGVHAISPCSRNLTDAQIDAVAASGGLVGIVFACFFLRPDFANDPDTPLQQIVAHVRHVAARVGVAHVAFGSDFDGATVPAALGDVAGYPRLLDALAAAGFSPAEIRAIAWENWRRVLGDWWR
ncbi:MAG TPA: dipeptidase [Solirubrobacteraceae bacterium]|nr:dipeptidase [Solirubrobacteraceae bacterium]